MALVSGLYSGRLKGSRQSSFAKLGKQVSSRWVIQVYRSVGFSKIRRFIEGLIFVMLKEKKEKWYTKEKSWISDTLTGTVARTV